MDKELAALEKTLGLQFQNINLLKEALTHRSYLNENPSWKLPHNERLEFLGDAVLELVVTEYLYIQYPDSTEGRLTSIRAALVNYQMIAVVAQEIKLDNFILLSKGEAKDLGRAREVILANAWEALLGSVYLDKGYEETKRVIEKQLLLPHLKSIVEKELYRDPKSQLQELVQEKMRVTPAYKLLKEWGPDHDKKFKMGVYFDRQKIAEGEGYSKQEAEVDAARNALQQMLPKS